MALFDTGTGLFMGGVVRQQNMDRQLSVQEAGLGLQKTKLGIELDKSQKEQASKFIEELVNIASEIKKNYRGTSDEFGQSKAMQSVEALIGKADELAQQTGLPVIDYRTKIMSIPTSVDESNLKLEQEIVAAERKIEAAGDDPQKQGALGVEKPSMKDFFVNVPGTGLVDLRGDKPQVIISADAAATSSKRYRVVAGVGLVDLKADGGPAVSIPASRDPSVQKVIAPIIQKMANGQPLTEGEQKAIDVYQRATTQDLLLREALASQTEQKAEITTESLKGMSLEELGQLDLNEMTDAQKKLLEKELDRRGL